MAFVTAAVGTTRSLFPTGPVRAVKRRGSLRRAASRRVAPALMAADGGTASFSGVADASKLRIGVVSARWNLEHVSPMVTSVTETLASLGVAAENIVSMQVPGAFELPMATRLMCAAQKVDAVVCLGVLIKGETHHYEYIASAVSTGLMDLQLTTLIPVIFGVLTCENETQAAERSSGGKSEAGVWARTAVEMAGLRASQIGGVAAGKKSVGFF